MKQIFIKFFIYLFSSIIITILLSAVYIYIPNKINSFDNNIRDLYFLYRGELPKNDNVIIVDIDERALSRFGQWPWSRDLVSKLVQNINDAGAAVIGFDIIFAEKDKTSPNEVIKNLNIDTNNLDIPNYDEIFANTLKSTPSILGYQFQLIETQFVRDKTPNIPAIFIEKNKNNQNDLITKAHGAILNIPLLQNSGYSSGFINNIPDISGVTRSVPLLIQSKNQIFPSLALEIIRNIMGVSKVIVNYDQNGVENIVLGDLTIPTDSYGRLLINYRGYEKHFTYISAYDILYNKFDKNLIDGKVVLIGTSAAGLFDLRATPFESIFPGVEIHANAIDNILLEDFIATPSWIHGANLLHIFILSFIILVFVGFSIWYIYLPFILLLVWQDIYFTYWALFTKGIVLNLFFPFLAILFSLLLAIVIKYFFQIKQNQLIKLKFSSKVSNNVMDALLKTNQTNILQTQEKEITVFFSDIRDFTRISEQFSNPAPLVSYLNNYINPMSDIITKYQGTIDKYIGDSIMAYWNAPLNTPDHCTKAVDSAIEQIKLLKKINKQLEQKNMPLLNIGIGIHTGNAIVGEIGSVSRSDYTIIGDTVNTASRLENLCKQYKTNIIISDAVKNQLTKEYNFNSLGEVHVKGKQTAIKIYEIKID
jgi:adenylate cyclase